MIKADEYYKLNLKEILDNGHFDENPRPKYADGTKAHSKFITQVFEKYDINKNEFPITTLRNTAIKTGIKEILWIYQDQDSSLITARNRGINWWNEWNIGDDTIGQRYGATVKRYDLMNKLLTSLKNDPFSRRHIINLWQEHDLSETKGLQPCAYETIWSVKKIGSDFYLDLTLNQRSNDYLMAGYINKIQYVALQMMVASHLGYLVGNFSHVYDRHFNGLNELLNKIPLETQPTIKLKTTKSFYDFNVEDFEISGVDGITKLSTNLELAI